MAKPDNRADNVERLQETVQNTVHKMKETEEYLAEHAEEISPYESSNLRAKNERRREAIADQRREIQDEARARE